MNRTEFLIYNDRYCKFKLKGGKEIFGIVWENNAGEKIVFYFASLVERMKIKEKGLNEEATGKSVTEIDLKEIVAAEPILQRSPYELTLQQAS